MPGEPQLGHDAPWKQRFRLPDTYVVQIVPSTPARGLISNNQTGLTQLYAWELETGKQTRVTDHATGIWYGVLSPDGHYIYYLDDQQGDEIGHLVRIPFAGGVAEDLTPDLPLYAVPFESDVFGLSFSQSGNRLGFSTANESGFFLHILELGPDGALGARRTVLQTSDLVVGPKLSYDGELISLDRTEKGEGLQLSIQIFDATSGKSIATLHDQESSVQTLMFSPLAGDSRLLGMTNRSGYNRPLLWNPRTGERQDIELTELDGEVLPLDWSSDGQYLLLKQFYQAVPRLFIYDLERQELRRLEHPESGYIGYAGFGPSFEVLIARDDSTHPMEVISLSYKASTTPELLLAAPVCPPGRRLTSVSFASSDGQMIQGWLGLPEGAGPFPVIIETHGGPTGVATSGFWPPAQAWLDHGFAYLTVNYRGSISFGRAFEEQIWGDIGHWEVEDMVAARAWLVEQGHANPRQVFLTGWSYGGYLTLLALGVCPGLWAGGMAGVAVADAILSYEDEADTLKGYDVGLYKGTPEEKPELYRRSSPITYAENVVAPIIVIQGRNDTRCPPRQLEVYEARLKELGKAIEVAWFDAGHATISLEQRIEDQERFLLFAHQVLQVGRDSGNR